MPPYNRPPPSACEHDQSPSAPPGPMASQARALSSLRSPPRLSATQAEALARHREHQLALLRGKVNTSARALHALRAKLAHAAYNLERVQMALSLRGKRRPLSGYELWMVQQPDRAQGHAAAVEEWRDKAQQATHALSYEQRWWDWILSGVDEANSQEEPDLDAHALQEHYGQQRHLSSLHSLLTNAQLVTATGKVAVQSDDWSHLQEVLGAPPGWEL